MSIEEIIEVIGKTITELAKGEEMERKGEFDSWSNGLFDLIYDSVRERVYTSSYVRVVSLDSEVWVMWTVARYLGHVCFVEGRTLTSPEGWSMRLDHYPS